jgi:hypothetical protein
MESEEDHFCAQVAISLPARRRPGAGDDASLEDLSARDVARTARGPAIDGARSARSGLLAGKSCWLVGRRTFCARVGDVERSSIATRAMHHADA